MFKDWLFEYIYVFFEKLFSFPALQALTVHDLGVVELDEVGVDVGVPPQVLGRVARAEALARLGRLPWELAGQEME